MKVIDVAEILHLAQVDPGMYTLNGIDDETSCLLAFGQAWHVFYSERGLRTDERIFDTEDAACVYFLKEIFGSSTLRYLPLK